MLKRAHSVKSSFLTHPPLSLTYWHQRAKPSDIVVTVLPWASRKYEQQLKQVKGKSGYFNVFKSPSPSVTCRRCHAVEESCQRDSFQLQSVQLTLQSSSSLKQWSVTWDWWTRAPALSTNKGQWATLEAQKE